MDPREASIREYTPEEIADPHALKAYHEKVLAEIEKCEASNPNASLGERISSRLSALGHSSQAAYHGALANSDLGLDGGNVKDTMGAQMLAGNVLGIARHEAEMERHQILAEAEHVTREDPAVGTLQKMEAAVAETIHNIGAKWHGYRLRKSQEDLKKTLEGERQV